LKYPLSRERPGRKAWEFTWMCMVRGDWVEGKKEEKHLNRWN
jgi:hypothetical protein